MALDSNAEEEMWRRLRTTETDGAVLKTKVESMEKKIGNIDEKMDKLVWKFFVWITGVMVLVNGLTAMWIKSGAKAPQ